MWWKSRCPTKANSSAKERLGDSFTFVSMVVPSFPLPIFQKIHPKNLSTFIYLNSTRNKSVTERDPLLLQDSFSSRRKTKLRRYAISFTINQLGFHHKTFSTEAQLDSTYFFLWHSCQIYISRRGNLHLVML